MAANLRETMPYTSAYPDLGTGPVEVGDLLSPAAFELERERIFRRTWLKVGRVEELPGPGAYKVKRIDVARTSVLLVRGEDGAIRAWHNVCPHRGNKLVPETGNETFGRAPKNLLWCRFHGWVFKPTGECVTVPRREAFGALPQECTTLKPIACDVWEGFVFVHLAATPPQSLAEFLGGIGAHFSGYPYGDSGTAYRYSSVLNCNWKVAMYAFTEGYHVPTIHRPTLPSLAVLQHDGFRCFGPHSTSTLYVPLPKTFRPTPATGVFAARLAGSATHGPRLQELPPDINPARRADFQFEFPSFFPNFVLHLCAGNGYPGMTWFSHQFWPLAHDRTLWEGSNYFRTPRTASERVAIAHTVALHRNAWLEDTSTMEDTHEGLASGALERMPLMDEEIMIRNHLHHWRRHMATA